MSKITVTVSDAGENKLNFVRFIKEFYGIGYKEAMEIANSLEKEPKAFTFDYTSELNEFVDGLSKLGINPTVDRGQNNAGSAASQPTSLTNPEPAQKVCDNTKGIKIIKGFVSRLKDFQCSNRSLAGTGLKTRPERVEVCSTNGKGMYYLMEGQASSKVKEIANTLGIEYKPGWQAARIAQEVLKHVLGSEYENPTRGESFYVYNCAIFDGWLLLHTYENDGFGLPNSIKTGCYVYH